MDLFFYIYENRRKGKELNYKANGIKSIKIAIRPEYHIKLPLDVIFKRTHTTTVSPLIKYNSSVRNERIYRDNVYRLYTDNETSDGQKIPILQKAVIFKLIKLLGKTKSVSVFIQVDQEIATDVYCEFDENCNITINAVFVKTMNVNEIEEFFKQQVNPVINEIKKFLEEGGYKINSFDSLMNEYVDIIEMNYQIDIAIKNIDLQLNALRGCITSVFIIESPNELRFKRVANFNKKNSQEAFIIEQNSQKISSKVIIKALVDNYQMTPEDADVMYREIIDELELSRNVKKRENSGFKTVFDVNKQTSVVTINILNINHISYLSTIPIYIDSLIRMTQDKDKSSSLVPMSEITELCSQEVIVLNDEVSVAVDSDINYDSDTDFDKNKINAFELDNDERYNEKEEQEEGDYAGGANNTDSSVSSIDLQELNSSPSASVSSSSLSNNSLESSISLEDEKVLPAEQSKDTSSLSFIPQNIQGKQDQEQEEGEAEEGEQQEEGESEAEEQGESEAESEAEEGQQEEQKGQQEEKQQEPKLIKRAKFQSKRKPIEELIDIDGMSLKNPYLFQDRIQQRDPSLILIKKEGNFDRYSRICPSSTKRQPVILTKAEKDKIDKEHPNFLQDEDVIKYGSDEKNPYYYICPRYWCLKTNSVISEEDVKKEKCGKILPKDAKFVKKGYYTYEFYTPSKQNEKRYPGFQVDSHPKGYCLPCCFKSWNTTQQLNHRKTCQKIDETKKQKRKEGQLGQEKTKGEETKGEETKGQEGEERQEETKEEGNQQGKPKANTKIEIDEYIKDQGKVPLNPGRLGYLPVQMQKLLHEVNFDCQISKLNSNIKLNHACLLRHGVEISETQSFIACIADAIFFARKNENGELHIPTIKEMKNIIIKTLTPEKFIKYQNGNLITDFYKANDNVDVSKYTNPLNIEREKFKQVISAFENFINFLKNDKVIINYSYLWDIVTSPNKNLFQSGINLIIFQIVNNDTTNNIELICPTNHYSGKFYDARKPNLLLLQQGNYFEPIYSYKDTGKKREIIKTFSEYDPQISKTMMAVFTKIIKPQIKNICSPKKYTMKSPLLLYNLIELLQKKKYNINTQIVNYDLKVIGVIAEKNDKAGFIPCYPSAINDTYEYSYMTDDYLWSTYPDTIEFLKQVVGKNHLIPCKPAFNVIEDEHIIGILTETDQFIQLSEPYPLSEVTDDIPTLDNTGYLVKNPDRKKDKLTADSVITTSNKVDTKRIEYIKKIKLESQFYNVFRNTIRILLNDYENLKMRENIEAELNKKYMIYSHKLKIIYRLIKELVDTKVQFIGDKNFYKSIDNVSICINSKCNTSTKLCKLGENNECYLVLPEKHLLTEKDNEDMYYTKFADELIRYTRIKSFIFQPQAYLSFDNVGYNLHENEILLLEPLITQEYFQRMIPVVKNNFIKYNSYDEVTPLNANAFEYDNIIDLNDAIHQKEEDTCAVVIRDTVRSIYWKKCFPSSYGEIEYGKTNYCSLFFIIDLINKTKGVLLTVNEIKKELYQEYTKYLPNYKNKILDILTIQGKQTLCDQVKKQTLTFINFIYTESYFFTTLDLWILIEKYKIPSFFISSKFLLETDYQKHSFNSYGLGKAQQFVFIIIPGLRNENVPSYKLICDNTNEIFISMDKLVNDERIEELNDPSSLSTVEEFLKKFSKKSTTKYNKKVPVPEVEVKRKYQYIDSPPQAPAPAVPPQPVKKVKLRVVDKPRVEKDLKGKGKDTDERIQLELARPAPPPIKAEISLNKFLVQSTIKQEDLEPNAICDSTVKKHCVPHSLFYLGLITYETAYNLSTKYCNPRQQGVDTDYTIRYLSELFNTTVFIETTMLGENNDLLISDCNEQLSRGRGTPIIFSFKSGYQHGLVLYNTLNGIFLFIDPQQCERTHNIYHYNTPILSGSTIESTNKNRFLNIMTAHNVESITFYYKRALPIPRELNWNAQFIIDDVAYGRKTRRKKRNYHTNKRSRRHL